MTRCACGLEEVCILGICPLKPTAAPCAPDRVEQIVQDRGKTHGSFEDNGAITMTTLDVWHAAPNWYKLPPYKRYALMQIAAKVGRILSEGADPYFEEHWDDIGGYAKKGGERL